MEVLQNIKDVLTSQEMTNGCFLLTIGAIWVVMIFRRGILKHLIEETGIATKQDLEEFKVDMRKEMEAFKVETRRDIAELRVETKRDIAELRNSTSHDIEGLKVSIQTLRENDFFHTNMAILLLSQETVKNAERFERIKDMIREATPPSRKAEIEAIRFVKADNKPADTPADTPTAPQANAQ